MKTIGTNAAAAVWETTPSISWTPISDRVGFWGLDSCDSDTGVTITAVTQIFDSETGDSDSDLWHLHKLSPDQCSGPLLGARQKLCDCDSDTSDM